MSNLLNVKEFKTENGVTYWRWQHDIEWKRMTPRPPPPKPQRPSKG